MRLFVTLLILFIAACARPHYSTTDFAPSVDESAAATQCRVPFEHLGCLTWRWLQAPNRKRTGTMLVKIGRPNYFDQSFVPLTPAGALRVNLDMPAMHHGSMETPNIKVVDVGTYEVSNLFFSMQGYWLIHFQIMSEQTVVDEAQIPLDYQF